MSKLEYKDIVQDQKGGQFTVVDGIVDAIAPLVSECHRAQRHAVRRGISVSQFQEEYPQPETKWIRHQASTREQTRPCYLTLRLEVAFGFDATPQILRLDWTATSIAPAFPSRSMSFRSLNELHVKVPSPVPQDDDHDVSAPSHQSDLTVTISAHGISVVDGMSSVSAGNSFSINSVNRAVTINYINNIGDAFLGPITASNIGGTQNVNTICMDAVESSSPRVVQPLSRRRALPLPQEIARSMHKWSGSRFGG
ncbi:hypothetical protein EYR36_001887 [Pleurotus pulmonarius]|nr:hypothetical protein EYR36_001887 [Pleurotus pulmonarius]KAF4588358.1 hypothetical protein EYR38_010326 [Pleurotus pulmonarius]